MKRTIGASRKDFDKANLETANRVLRNPEAHGGEGSITVVWAKAVLERLSGQRA